MSSLVTTKDRQIELARGTTVPITVAKRPQTDRMTIMRLIMVAFNTAAAFETVKGGMKLSGYRALAVDTKNINEDKTTENPVYVDLILSLIDIDCL